MNTVKIGESMRIGRRHPIVLIAGPCVIESAEHCLLMAEKIKAIAAAHDVPLVFKASYDKANRTSVKSYRGPGLKRGLEILADVKRNFDLPVLSDVHTENQVGSAAEVLDILQIPAFLCRQTDLVLAAAKTGKPVNVKKGQFLAPWDVSNIVKKIESAGNHQILLTERGTSFGYNRLVCDMGSLVIMREYGYPVAFDATHSVQEPGGMGDSSGGACEMSPYLARAAAAIGLDALFVEVHDNPKEALSDGPNMITPEELDRLLEQVKRIDRIVNEGESFQNC